MPKYLLVAFQGEQMCFVHVLLNALDMHSRGLEVRIIMEGMATQLVTILGYDSHAFAALYNEVKAKGLVEGVCRACATRTGAVESTEAQGLAFLSDISGHPSLARYLQNGWTVLTF
ncbi:MAG: DsrE family protein [Clostridia bacterium]|nr:DsrE family protein [Clostridia bacterium]